MTYFFDLFFFITTNNACQFDYQLEDALEITRQDLTDISRDVQTDLDRFQQEKIRDLKEMLIAYAKAHIQYCQQVVEEEEGTLISVTYHCIIES